MGGVLSNPVSSVMWSYRDWRNKRILARTRIEESVWIRVFDRLPLLRRLNPGECARLRELSLLFLHAKVIEPVQGLELNQEQRLQIALQACLLILNLDLDWFDGWIEIIVYPGAFITRHEAVDAAGVVQTSRNILSGEAWERGPVVLSWDEIETSGQGLGHDVIIHEMAHKLDMLDGVANGYPPIHPQMSPHDWSTVFAAAYDDLNRRCNSGEESEINPYAAENPAEFFAVCSEYFFDSPRVLARLYPGVYGQLCLFYRQTPLRLR